MSGHSKWNNIKQRKGAEDKKRAKAFTKAARSITSAVKEGGSSDRGVNPTLRTAIEKARSINMPKENIERAIQRGTAYLGQGGVGEDQKYFEIVYEAYSLEGVAMLINVVTDNKNRSASEVKNVLKRFGGSLGEPGCAVYAFNSGGANFKVPLEKTERFQELLEELDVLEDVVEITHNAALQ